MASEMTMDPFLAPSGSPPEPQNRHEKSWDELRQAVRNTRKMLTSLASRVPTNFKFRTVRGAEGHVTKLYFLGMNAGSRESSLLYVDIPPFGMDSPPWSWKYVLDSFQAASAELSKEEQLMRERQRLGTLGITSYDLHEHSGMLVFPACNSLFHCELPDVMVEESILPVNVSTACSGARLDPKICPTIPDLVGFINNNDIWVTSVHQGTELRLTYSHKGGVPLAEDPRSSGVPSFVVQEEFNRYTGYWWQPKYRGEDASNVCRILFEEVDESEVEILHIYSPSEDGVEDFRYPRAGTSNARCCLKLMEFELVEVDVGEGQVHLPAIEDVIEKQLYEPLSTLLPWMEYLVRAGWTPDAKYVWAEVLSRNQCRVAIVLIPPECFIPVPKDMEVGSFDSSVFPPIQVIYEDRSDVWVNVHDLIHFFPQEKDSEISFIWGSEKSGYRHLYHVIASLQQPDFSNPEMEGQEGSLYHSAKTEVALTCGDWEVSPKQLWVDEERKLVLFVGLRDTPLESHLYAVSYLHPSDPVRLTEPGYSHIVECNKECRLFVSVYSNVTSAPCSKVFQVHQGPNGAITTQTLGVLLGKAAPNEDHKTPELFEYKNSAGHTAYGMLYRPHFSEPGVQYPTVLFVYGGPQVQLVTNAFKGLKFLRLHMLASQGYAVVVLDGRGSVGRGLHFESIIKNNLGVVELEDQVEGLLWIASQVNCIDLARVAIHGWSYGGYLSLLGLLQRPDIFKVAIVGAPVVMWSLYDTGYTERYLGTPQDNSEAYDHGSILRLVEKFPDQENRLLIIHGLIDENVHFQHTSVLVNALVKACKPYQLQVYPNERHGIRNHESGEHYKTMVLSFLQQHL